MRALVQVARREVAERKMVFLLGLVLGVLPLLVLPFVHAGPEARAWASLFNLITFAWGAAVLIGGTVYSRDLADRRIAFYFARPLSPAAILGGKFLGAAALIVGGGVLTVLPAVILGDFNSRALSSSEAAVVIWLFAIGIALLLIPLANYVGIALRSRSPWILLDMGAAAVSALLIAWSWRIIWRNAYGEFVGIPAAALLIVLPLFCLIGAFVQAFRARTDLVAAHRIAGMATWGPILALSFATAAGTYWFMHPAPSSLNRILESAVDRTGRWALLKGTAAHRPYMPFAFLVDLQNPDRFLSFGAVPYQWDIDLSADGKRVAWLTIAKDASPWRPGDSGRTPKLEVVTARLEGERPTLHHPMLFVNPEARIAISPSGARTAVVSDGTVTVIETDTGATVASAKIPARHFLPTFVDEEHVRLTQRWSGEAAKRPETRLLSLLDFDLRAKSLTETGQVELAAVTWTRIGIDPSGERLLVLPARSPVQLCDGKTGRPLVALTDGSGMVPAAGFLEDGRIILAVLHKGEGATLHLFSHDGAPLKQIPLGKARTVRLGAQPTSRSLVVTLSNPDSKGYPVGDQSVLVDLEEGRVVRQLPGVVSISASTFFGAPARIPGAKGASLFVEEGKVVELDLSSGARKVLLPR